jgi:hypothetical protein
VSPMSSNRQQIDVERQQIDVERQPSSASS